MRGNQSQEQQIKGTFPTQLPVHKTGSNLADEPLSGSSGKFLVLKRSKSTLMKSQN